MIVLCLYCGFIQKWYVPRGVANGFGRILVCDSDRDSRCELIFGYYENLRDQVVVYEQYPDNQFHLQTIIDTMTNETWDLGDFDNDGLIDVILSGDFGLPVVGPQIYESPDSFSYPTQEVWRDTAGPPLVLPISVYDIDQDGLTEIVKDIIGPSAYLGIYEATSNNHYELVFSDNPDTSQYDAPSSTHACGDFDGDGKTEFAMGGTGSSSIGAPYWIYECISANSYEKVNGGFILTLNIKDCISVPDADQDGKPEFVVKGFYVGGPINAFIFEAVGDNAYQVIKTFDLPGGDYDGGYSDTGDVDGNSIAEIVLEARQDVLIIKASGNDSFYIWDSLPGHSSGSCVRVTDDIDSNGLNEIVVSGNNETRIYEYDAGAVEEIALRSPPYALHLKVYPNPFTERTTITLQIPSENPKCQISIRIYDIAGRFVKKIDSDIINGTGVTNWFGNDSENWIAPPGIYFIQIYDEKGKILNTQKILKIK